MALSAQEEALVRQLLDQQAAILSLAGNEATITSKLGATKVTLADLVAANAVADADLLLMRQGTNDKSVTAKKLADYIALQVGIPTAVAGGTADAITADFTPNVALTNGTTVIVRASAANTTTTPTFAPDGLTAKTIVKGNNLPLAVGDIAGAGHWLELAWDSTLSKWVLLNPATFNQFGASLGGNGYQKLPSGLIIQWGNNSCAATNPSSVTFPIAFPNACRNLNIGSYQGTDNIQSYGVLNSYTSSSFTWSAFYANSGVAPVGVSGAGQVAIFWIAVGH